MSQTPTKDLSPLLVRQWHPTKNGDFLPSDFTAGSSKKVWWQDEHGHEWEAKIWNRTNGSGCLVCTGKQLLIGYNDLDSQRPTLAALWDHGTNGINPEEVFVNSSKEYYWKCSHSHSWKASPARIQAENCPVCEFRVLSPGINDLATTHPELSKEWHSTKNANKKPYELTSRSSTNVWWLGNCGHEWKNPVSRRALKGKGCPICANSQVLSTFNDLATTHPSIAGEWHPTKNGSLLPSQFTYGSNAKIWWIDEFGHEWQTTIRGRQQNSCPICSSSVVLTGLNDLASQAPGVARGWDYDKNKDVTPETITAYTHVKQWWLCEKNHSWEATVGSRVQGAKCPYCVGTKVLSRFNDLQHLNPTLAATWHPTENTKTPQEVGLGSHYRAKWVCPKHGTWEAVVKDRVGKKSGCPSCAHSVSQPELDLKSFLESFDFTVKPRVTNILPSRQEIDLYLPDRNFGIEFNGLYWHSEEQGKGRNYHQDKYLAAKAAGVQLLQIWEDDWRDRKPVILRALAHKLGVTDKLAELYPELETTTSKVFARKTQVVMLGTSQAKAFLEFNHIQGFVSGSYYLGLQDADNVLRAVLVLKKEPGTNDKTLNIVRYATAGSVTGGFTKLLKYAIRAYEPDDFITFADHAISDGGLYESNGFVVDKILPPDYMYVVKGERKHKFGYRLKRFKNDPELLWDEGFSERQLAQLNNIPRIWDAGKTRYRFTV